MNRWILRIGVAASLLLILSHFAYTVSTYHALTLQSVQFAELGLPLLFVAFLNGIVWSGTESRALARWTTHVANVLMLITAVLVARFAPVAPAFMVLVCAAILALAGVLADAGRIRSA